MINLLRTESSAYGGFSNSAAGDLPTQKNSCHVSGSVNVVQRQPCTHPAFLQQSRSSAWPLVTTNCAAAHQSDNVYAASKSAGCFARSMHRARRSQLPSHSLQMTEFLRIERARADILGHRRQDLMTVTFSGVVTRNSGFDFDLDYYEALAEEQGWPFDADAICRAMDYTQTWTDVSRIRLVDAGSDIGRGIFHVDLVRQLFPHGEETVRLPRLLHFGLGRNMTDPHIFSRDLIQLLHLRFGFVDGADQYAVQ
jgi:hypothetical protein